MVTADSVFAADARGVWSVSPFTPASTSTLPPPQPISTHPQRVSKPFKTTKISNMRETRDTSSRRREQTRLLEQDATKFWDFVNAGQLFDWDKGSWREFYKTFPRQDVVSAEVCSTPSTSLISFYRQISRRYTPPGRLIGNIKRSYVARSIGYCQRNTGHQRVITKFP